MSRENTAPNNANHLVEALKADIRYDDRKKNDIRNITIETDVIKTAEGSARITAGNTEILVGVKLSLGTPYADRPDEGVLMVGCELLPIAHPSIESGPPSINAIEIGRVIDRGIRESGAIDTKSLCITPGEKVWIVSVDITPLNHDGNLIDIGSLGAIAALKTTKFPEIKEDGSVDYKHPTDKGLTLVKEPIPVTVSKIKDQLFVDATFEEEKLIESRLTISVLADDKLCSLQKGGEVGMTLDEVKTCFDIAINTAKEFRKKL